MCYTQISLIMLTNFAYYAGIMLNTFAGFVKYVLTKVANATKVFEVLIHVYIRRYIALLMV